MGKVDKFMRQEVKGLSSLLLPRATGKAGVFHSNQAAAIRKDMSPLIAFDLDGVLYSSESFLGEAYREAIENVNRRRPGSFERVPSTREILDHVGWPVPVILERLFPRVDEEAVTLLYEETLDVICARVRRREGKLYDEVPQVLDSLCRSGHTLAVASNGRRLYIEAVLSTYGLSDFFIDRLSADELGSKTAVLRGYLAQIRPSPSQTIMIGDRASDVEAARAVGCRFIGCDYGHGYRNEIENAGPVAQRFAQIPDIIADLLARAVE